MLIYLVASGFEEGIKYNIFTTSPTMAKVASVPTPMCI